MGGLPPVAPVVGTSNRVRLGRDYYVRVAGNDYSVDPNVIGRFVDVHAGLTTVGVTCAGTVWPPPAVLGGAPDHHRPRPCLTAAALRTAFQARTATIRGPAAAAGAVVGVRALSDYDDMFALPPSPTPPAAGLQAAR